MFLPPVAPGVQWLNDPEGSQPRANVSFAIISAWYRAMAERGFADYSYANVNEYGINVVLPPPQPPRKGPLLPPPRAELPLIDDAYIARLFARVARVPGAGPQICEATWMNASACLAEAFPDAVVEKSWDEIGGRVERGSYVSWQNAVVVDPGTEGYHAFMLEQLARHIIFEDAFVGYIIDRSDWMDVSSLARDDGLTFIPEAVNETGSGVGASLKVSYQRMVADLRAVLDAGPSAQAALRASLPPEQRQHIGSMNGTGLMMMNVVGNGRLDQFAPYDGIFSEGSLVSGAGLLGIMAPTILWTYDSNECCRTAAWADFYFQRHLLMSVMPMLPFPGNDHAIPFDAASAAYYVRYGPMMAAIAPSVWALLPHIVATVNATGFTYAKVNAFIAPLGADAADVALLVPVMLGEQPAGTVEVNLTCIRRVWDAPASDSAHPLVRVRARARAAAANPAAPAAAAASASYVVEALFPGQGSAWAQVAGPYDVGSFVVPVALQSGAALVRVRRVSAV